MTYRLEKAKLMTVVEKTKRYLRSGGSIGPNARKFTILRRGIYYYYYYNLNENMA
jgi:hypothetical protein